MSHAGATPPPPSSKAYYHIWGFDPAGASGKNATLASILMEGFMKVINDFKSSMGNSVGQLKKIRKLMDDANELMALLNEITNTSKSTTGLYSKIKAQIGKLEGDIKQIAGGKPLEDIPYLQQLQNNLDSVKKIITNKPFLSIFESYIKLTNELKEDFKKMYSGEKVDPTAFYNLCFELNGLKRQFKHMEKALKNPEVLGEVPEGVKDALKTVRTWWSKVSFIGSEVGPGGVASIGSAKSKKKGVKKAEEFIQWFESEKNPYRSKVSEQDLMKLFATFDNTLRADGNKVHIPPSKVFDWIRLMNGASGEDWSWEDSSALRGEMGGLWQLWTEGKNGSLQIVNSTDTLSNSMITNINKDYTGINTVATVMAKMVNVPIRNVNFALQNLRSGLGR